jgi:very-short-patch-repair endonuclease
MSVLENAASDTSPQRGEARSALRPRSGARQAGRGEKHVWAPTPIPPALLQAARELRQHMTDAEHCLWQCLRGKQLNGFRFRKQHPIAHFVLDFYCPAAKLAIAIARAQHNTSPGRDSDEERTHYLNARGIRVLRFWNHEVWQDLPGVLERIWEALHLPPSVPPPAGER